MPKEVRTDLELPLHLVAHLFYATPSRSVTLLAQGTFLPFCSETLKCSGGGFIGGR
jgi:hypothetical protein